MKNESRKVGIHENIPAETYHSWDGCSQSMLKMLAESPAHLRDWMDRKHEEPNKPTDAQQIGTAIHCAVLEPVQWEKRYLIKDYDGRTRAGQELKSAAEKEGIILLKEKEGRWIDAIARRVRDNPQVQQWLNNESSMMEPSLVWDTDGYPCRCRLDLLCPSKRMIVDVKSTLKTYEEFPYEIVRRRYHWQAYWNIRGAESCGIECDRFVFVAAHKSRPFLVSFHEIRTDTEAYAIAGQECEAAFDVYKECMRTEVWPGYPDIPMPVELPGRKLEPVFEEAF